MVEFTTPIVAVVGVIEYTPLLLITTPEGDNTPGINTLQGAGTRPVILVFIVLIIIS